MSAECYAVIVLADNATFLLAENRIAASRLYITQLCVLKSSAAVAQLVAHQHLNPEVVG